MFKQSIQTKILSVAIAVTVIGFSGLIYTVISHEKKSLLEERENSSRLMAEPILEGIYDDMMEERPDIVRHLMEDMKKIKGTKRVQIVRSNGVEEAFQDLKTLKAVEKEYGKLKPNWIENHPNKEKNVADGTEYSGFREAIRLFAEGRKQEISYIEERDNERIFTYLAPIAVKPKCNTCHVTAEEARGVLMISTSLEDMYAAIASSRVRWITYGFFTVFAVSLLLIFIVRNIIRPLKIMTSSAQKIAGGNFSISIPVYTSDEVGTLSQSFNKMASELEAAKKELDRRIFEIFTLYNISKVLSTTFETEELLKEIVKKVSSNLGIEDVAVMLLDDKTQEIYVASCTAGLPDACKYVSSRYKVGEGFYGWVAMSGEARLIRDVSREKDIVPGDILNPEIQSILAVPFGVRGKVLGLLCAYKNRPGVFEREDFELLKAVAEHVAVALENARLYKETKAMAITDGLTGLYNHRFFVARLKEEIKRAERYNRPLSLMIMDIDYFKHYNDTHGHQGGDGILMMIADIIAKKIRNTDIAARYGGEEFVVISSETDKGQIIQMAERIRKVIEDYPFPLKETQPNGNLTVSIGVAAFKTDAANADELIKKADDALYKAKETGRNKVISA